MPDDGRPFIEMSSPAGSDCRLDDAASNVERVQIIGVVRGVLDAGIGQQVVYRQAAADTDPDRMPDFVRDDVVEVACDYGPPAGGKKGVNHAGEFAVIRNLCCSWHGSKYQPLPPAPSSSMRICALVGLPWASWAMLSVKPRILPLNAAC